MEAQGRNVGRPRGTFRTKTVQTLRAEPMTSRPEAGATLAAGSHESSRPFKVPGMCIHAL